MTDQLCPRCGCALKVIEVQVPVYDTIPVSYTHLTLPTKA